MSYNTITVAGIANSSCTDCATWNGTFKLCYIGNDTWESPAHTGTECSHVSGDPLWRLTYGGLLWTLTAVGMGTDWTQVISWTCSGINTVDLSGGGSGNCTSYPTTITIQPCRQCTNCVTDTMPKSAQVQISGISNSACVCSGVNATFVFDGFAASCQLLHDEPTLLLCPGIWDCSLHSWVSMALQALQLRNGNMGWRLMIILGTSGTLCSWGAIYYEWDSGGTAVFDCSVSRTLSYVPDWGLGDNYFCTGWESATVTLTPL